MQFQDYLVVELTEAAFQAERARVGEFGEYLQMSNQLSVGEETNRIKTSSGITLQPSFKLL